MLGGQLGILLRARHGGDLKMQRRALARLPAAVVLQEPFENGPRLGEATGHTHAVGESQAQPTLGRNHGHGPFQDGNRPSHVAKSVLAQREGFLGARHHGGDVIDLRAKSRQHAQQRFVVRGFAVQAGEHVPQRDRLGILAEGAFERGHGAMALASAEIGLRQLHHGHSPLGWRARGHALLQPVRGEKRLAGGLVQPRQRLHGRGIATQLDDHLVSTDGASVVAQLLLEERGGLAP